MNNRLEICALYQLLHFHFPSTNHTHTNTQNGRHFPNSAVNNFAGSLLTITLHETENYVHERGEPA